MAEKQNSTKNSTKKNTSKKVTKKTTEEVDKETAQGPRKAESVAEEEKKGLEGKDIVVTFANTADEIVEWNRKGANLYFDDAKFLELPEEVQRELRFENARRYFVARSINRRPEPDETLKKVQVVEDPFEKKTRKKLEHRHGDPNKHRTWKRPDEVEGAKENGYKVIKKPDGSSEKIDTPSGSTDLVAMEVDKSLYNQHIRAVGKRSRDKCGSVEEEARDRIHTSNPKVQVTTGK